MPPSSVAGRSRLMSGKGMETLANQSGNIVGQTPSFTPNLVKDGVHSNGRDGGKGTRGPLHSGTNRGSVDSDAARFQCAQTPRKLQFFKTKICPWYHKGGCDRGLACQFAHGLSELRECPDLRKTSLCPNVKRGGSCTIPGCHYAHRVHELRATGQLYKTALCVRWQMGRCNAGSLCRHAHGKNEMRNGRGVPPLSGPGDDSLPPLLVGSRSPSLPAGRRLRSRTSAPVTFFQATRRRQSQPFPFDQLETLGEPGVYVPCERRLTAQIGGGHEAHSTSLLLSKLIASKAQSVCPVLDAQRGEGHFNEVNPHKELQIQLRRATRGGVTPAKMTAKDSDVLCGQSAAVFQLNSLRRPGRNEGMASTSNGQEGPFGDILREAKSLPLEQSCGSAAALALENLTVPRVNGGFERLPLLGAASEDTLNRPQIIDQAIVARDRKLGEIFSPLSVDLDPAELQTSWNVPLLHDDFVASLHALSSRDASGHECPRSAGICRRDSVSVGTGGNREGSRLPPSTMVSLHARELGSGRASVRPLEGTVPRSFRKTSGPTPTLPGSREIDGEYSFIDKLQCWESRNRMVAQDNPFACHTASLETGSGRPSCNTPLASGQPGTKDTGSVTGSSEHTADVSTSGYPPDLLAMHRGCRRASSGASTIDTTPRSIDALSGLLCSLSLSPYSPTINSGPGCQTLVGRRDTFDASGESVVSGALNKLRTASSEDSHEPTRERPVDMLAVHGSIQGSRPSVETCSDSHSIRQLHDIDAALGYGLITPIALTLSGVRGSQFHVWGVQGGRQSELRGNGRREKTGFVENPDSHSLQSVNVPNISPGLESVCGWIDKDNSCGFGVGKSQQENLEETGRDSDFEKGCSDRKALDISDVSWEGDPDVQYLRHEALPESASLCKEGQALSIGVTRASVVQCVTGAPKSSVGSERQAVGELNAQEESTVCWKVDEKNRMREENVCGGVPAVRSGCIYTPYDMGSCPSGRQRRAKDEIVSGANLGFLAQERVVDEHHDTSELLSEIEAFRRTCCDSGASVSTCCSRREPADTPVGNAVKGEQSDNSGCRVPADSGHCSVLFSGPDLFRASWDLP
ncbi:zinc finger (CCCH type) motif-containing protein [Toxoplasma gondii ME49]|uniref:Zinc finger (CCCH type) motif-containing protein n=1 Tax=Toxoplasma gondii (strain ATCC 50611 / Me49) TaxID=508771 RepID=S8EN13_TOXGM|nr:zinc finger (CCCH type) motif-containing protein [Toxoplasma gondii ME49]EPT24636.1 zinc finger (CCCH type) motif-containing protein [Toxoplasma gondii ME49]|eukprot:XP_018634816.1 zinc finger (CCCH type) motif-containing protein [Toxoplasma gondii ME49]